MILLSPALASVPAITAPVTDLAEVLDPADERALDLRIRALQAATGVQLAVLTVGALPHDATIGTFSIEVAERWQGGEAGRDDGLLVVLAVADRRSRVEVGYGLEGYVTDAEAARLLQTVAPALREGAWASALGGVVEGLAAEVAELRPGEDVPASRKALAQALRWLPDGAARALFGAALGGGSLLVMAAGPSARRRHRAVGLGALWCGVLAVLAFAQGAGPTSAVALTGGAGLLTFAPVPLASDRRGYALGAALATGLIAVAGWLHAGDPEGAVPIWTLTAVAGPLFVAAICLGGSGGSGGGSSTPGGATPSSGSSSGGSWGGGGGRFGGGGASGSW